VDWLSFLLRIVVVNQYGFVLFLIGNALIAGGWLFYNAEPQHRATCSPAFLFGLSVSCLLGVVAVFAATLPFSYYVLRFFIGAGMVAFQWLT